MNSSLRKNCDPLLSPVGQNRQQPLAGELHIGGTKWLPDGEIWEIAELVVKGVKIPFSMN